MKKEMKIRLFVTAATVCVMTSLYLNESDLAYNVAQQRAILLGRYTLESAITLLILTIIAFFVIMNTWKNKPEKSPRKKREDAFKTITLTLSILLTVVIFDVGLRVVQSAHYVKKGHSYHRQPNQVFEGVFEDKPETHFTYPKPSKGYPDVSYTLTIDDQGFRNANPTETADWLILGDSFAEGSCVTDNEVWCAMLVQNKDVTLYNLGMAGGNPLTYLDTLKKFGLAKKPNKIVYMLYEGNDFRDSNFDNITNDERPKESLGDIVFKRSPLRNMIKSFIERNLSPVDAKRFLGDQRVNNPSHPMYPVAWLPLEVPAGSGNFYTFDLKRLLQHLVTAEEFNESLGCKESKRLLGKTKALCDENNIQLIVVYAPDKPNILLDEVIRQVPVDQLTEFLAIKAKNLPDPLYPDILRDRITVQENTFKEFCKTNNIEFLSLTEPLREATLSGIQTYFTYDQHWTPEAHTLIADYLAEQIN
jgi:hypothetical protein